MDESPPAPGSAGGNHEPYVDDGWDFATGLLEIAPELDTKWPELGIAELDTEWPKLGTAELAGLRRRSTGAAGSKFGTV